MLGVSIAAVTGLVKSVLDHSLDPGSVPSTSRLRDAPAPGDEIADDLSLDIDMSEDYDEIYEKAERGYDFFKRTGVRTIVRAADGCEIHVATFSKPEATERPKEDRVTALPGSRGHGAETLVLMTGWSEAMVKYGELIQDLLEGSSSLRQVVIFDHRSQGFSGPHTRDVTYVQSHVESFEMHVDDCITVIKHVTANSYAEGKVALMGFSMGGLVAATVAARKPELVSDLVLVAPALRLGLGDAQIALVKPLAVSCCLMGLGTMFVPSHPSSYVPRVEMPPRSPVSTSVARLAHWERLRERHPEIVINGMSWAHLLSLLNASMDYDAMSKIQSRTLIVECGRDTLVDNRALRELEEALGPEKCAYLSFPDAKHCILNEREAWRRPTVRAISGFLGGSAMHA